MPYTNLPEELWDKMDSCVAAHVAAGADKREAIAVCYTALTGRKIAGATQGDPDSSYLLLSTHACCAADCARAACWTVDAGGKELYYCNAHLPTGLKTLAVHGVRFDVKADDDLVRTPPPGPIATKLAQEVGRDDVTAAMIQQEIIDPWLMATIGTPASDRLQLLVAKTFGHSYPVDLEPLVKTLHWDLLYAIGQIYNDTEAFLKSKGFQRWQRLPVYHPYLTSHAVTKQWQVGDEVRIKLNPATAWTLDPAEAAKVATFLASRSAPALVLKTFIPASCVISTALTGFGTPGTEELVLAGGEYEALVDQRYDGGTKDGSFVTLKDGRVVFIGGAGAGGGGGAVEVAVPTDLGMDEYAEIERITAAAKDLARELGLEGEEKEQLAYDMVDWAVDSQSPAGIAFQIAAAQEFGAQLSDYVTHEAENLGMNPNGDFSTERAVLRTLKDRSNSRDMTLYRGTTRSDETNALESWTTSPEIAAFYAAREGGGVVISARIPASRIVGTWRDGLGLECAEEVVVHNGPL
jgi:hypothetical protein